MPTTDIRDIVILQHAPTVMAPVAGVLQELDRAGHRYIAARDGLYLDLQRPWLRLRQPIAPSIAVKLPYGEVKPAIVHLVKGVEPGQARLLLAAAEGSVRAALEG